MHKLGITDASFLYMESPSNPMNIGSVQLLDVPQRDGFFNELKLYLADRVRAIPFMCKRLKSTPFTLDQPVWVDDPTFAIDNHVTARRARRARYLAATRSDGGAAARNTVAARQAVVGVLLHRRTRDRDRWRGSASITTRASTAWPGRRSSTCCSRGIPRSIRRSRRRRPPNRSPARWISCSTPRDR